MNDPLAIQKNLLDAILQLSVALVLIQSNVPPKRVRPVSTDGRLRYLTCYFTQIVIVSLLGYKDVVSMLSVITILLC